MELTYLTSYKTRSSIISTQPGYILIWGQSLVSSIFQLSSPKSPGSPKPIALHPVAWISLALHLQPCSQKNPLVYITMEHHHFYWGKLTISMAMASSAMLVITRGYHIYTCRGWSMSILFHITQQSWGYFISKEYLKVTSKIPQLLGHLLTPGLAQGSHWNDMFHIRLVVQAWTRSRPCH